MVGRFKVLISGKTRLNTLNLNHNISQSHNLFKYSVGTKYPVRNSRVFCSQLYFLSIIIYSIIIKPKYLYIFFIINLNIIY